MALGTFFDCTWGSIRLWCARMTTDGGRTQVVHELAETFAPGEHPVQDRGPSVGKVSCEVLFIDMPTEAVDPMTRFRAFVAQINTGERLLFTHPIEGSYYVNAGAFNYALDEDGNLEDGRASIELIRSADVETPIPAGSATTIAAGAQRVAAASGDFADALADVGMESDIGTRAVDMQEAWEDADEVQTRQVLVDVAGLSTDLDAFITANELEDDLALWPVFVATIELGAAVRAAALAALAEAPKVTSIRISEAMSVLALAVRLYGGAEASDRSRQILNLNDIRTPAWIDVGTVLTIPVPRSSSFTRSAA